MRHRDFSTACCIGTQPRATPIFPTATGLPTPTPTSAADRSRRLHAQVQRRRAQQVALRWILEKGACYTCQTTSRQHFQEDIDVFDFELSAKDLAFLDGENLVL